MAEDTKDEITGEEIAGDEGYQFDDAEDVAKEEAPEDASKGDQGGGSQSGGSQSGGSQSGDQGGGGKFADELFTKTIQAKFRTFYVDLKESSNGKFVKISEKSRGRKSTIMMDSEDVPAMIEALQEVQGQL